MWPIWTRRQGNNGGEAVEGSLDVIRWGPTREGDQECRWRSGRERGPRAIVTRAGSCGQSWMADCRMGRGRHTGRPLDGSCAKTTSTCCTLSSHHSAQCIIITGQSARRIAPCHCRSRAQLIFKLCADRSDFRALTCAPHKADWRPFRTYNYDADYTSCDSLCLYTPLYTIDLS